MFRITKLLTKASLFRRFSTGTNRIAEQAAELAGPDSVLAEKARKIQQAQPYFDRLLYIDTDYLAHIPYFFKPIQPIVETIKDIMLSANSVLGMPWWAVIMSSCVVIRLTILPLLFIQIRKINQIVPIAPVLVHLRNSYKESSLPQHKKLRIFMKSAFQIIHSQNLKLYRLFFYNLVNYAFIITMVYSIRRLLSEPTVGSTPLLYIPNLSAIDPYFILPVATIALYYWNFQRFITIENKNTLMSKIRGVCQFLLILWLPFLCYWPSGIVLYMFTNALLSVIQSTVFMNPAFVKRISPKFLVYNFLLGIAEYDKAKSESIVETIKTGDDSLKERAISEELLVRQTEAMIKNLNKQLDAPEEEDQEAIKEHQVPAEKKHKQ